MTRWFAASCRIATSFSLLSINALAEAERSTEGDSSATTSLDPADSKPSDAPADYWATQPTRAFVSANLLAGYYSEATLSGGWGRAFDMWGGLSATVLGFPGMIGIAAGPRLDLLIANLSVRARRSWSSSRLAERTEVYSDASFSEPANESAQYTSVDVELWGWIPAGPTLGSWWFRSEWVPEVPDDRALLSDQMRYVIEDEPVFATHLIWWASLFEGSLLLGPAGDITWGGGRRPLIRAGASLVYVFGPHLSLDTTLTAPVTSPDNLSFGSEAWGNVGLSYSWASGEPRPGLP